MIKILVTGGSGFIGTNLINFLLENSISVLSIDVEQPKVERHLSFFKKCDIRDFELLYDCCSKFNPDYIIHLAARTDLIESKNINNYDSNIIGVQNLVRISDKLKSLKKIVYTSSMLVNEVGYRPKFDTDYNPNSLYGRSKVIGEQIVFESTFKNWVIIRPTSIWGPWFKEPYRNFFNYVLKQKYFSIPKVNCSTKTYGFVGNSVKQIFDITFSKNIITNTKIFYIGDYKPLNIFDWSNNISKIAGLKSIKAYPFILFKMGGYFGDFLLKLNINFPLTSFRIRNMSTNNIVDLSKTEEITPDLPFQLSESIQITIDWIKNVE